MKISYINLINDFWRKNNGRLSPPCIVMYFAVLHCINQNHWKPTRIVGEELSQMAGISRGRLNKYRDELIALGILRYVPVTVGRNVYAMYSLPMMETISDDAPDDAVIAPDDAVDDATAAPDDAAIASDDAVTAPNDAPHTLYIDKDVYKDVYQDVHQDNKCERQVEMLRKIVRNRPEMNKQLCTELGIDNYRLQELAEIVFEDWTAAQVVHDDKKGHFDIGGATRHLRSTIRIKHRAELERRKTQSHTRLSNEDAQEARRRMEAKVMAEIAAIHTDARGNVRMPTMAEIMARPM